LEIQSNWRGFGHGVEGDQYNDNVSGWFSGRSVLAFGDVAAIVALRGTTLALNLESGQIITYYFRTLSF
jgi:hypothetical protein